MSLSLFLNFSTEPLLIKILKTLVFLSGIKPVSLPFNYKKRHFTNLLKTMI